MKNKLTLLASTLLLCSLVACTTAPANSAPASASPAASEASIASESPLPEAVAAAKSGVVIAASMSTTEIEAPDGTVYQFAIDDATVVTGGGTALGNTIEVSFMGDYKAGTLATSITTLKEAEASVPTKNPSAETQTTDDTITGVVIDATMGTIIVENPNGTTYRFFIDDNTTFSGEGADIGNTVVVSFAGEYSDDIVAQEVTTTQVRTQTVSADYDGMPSITGIVTDVSMHSISIQVASDAVVTLKKTDDTQVVAAVSLGDSVQVYYTGDLKEGLEADQILLTDESFSS